MNCPVCRDSVLTISERQGIEIDFCPKCRGVWLDRGELDKIIERADAYREPAAPPPLPREQPRYDDRNDHRQSKPDDSHYGYQYQQPHGQPQQHYQKKRGGFWSELFD